VRENAIVTGVTAYTISHKYTYISNGYETILPPDSWTAMMRILPLLRVDALSPPLPAGAKPPLAIPRLLRHMPRRESGGRSCRQPGQVLTEAATVILLRVVPAPTFPPSSSFDNGCPSG
jgi:hypothetical protein